MPRVVWVTTFALGWVEWQRGWAALVRHRVSGFKQLPWFAAPKSAGVAQTVDAEVSQASGPRPM